MDRATLVADIPFSAIDFESAGIRRGGTEVPVQIGLAAMQGREIPAGDFFTSFLATDQPITWSAQKIHGIRTADLKDAPGFVDLWPQIKTRLENRWLVAHGAATEKRFLRAFPFHGFGPWVDTLKLARTFWPSLPSYALSDLIVSLGLEEELRALRPEGRWHDALFDAIASLVLLRHITADLGGESGEILLGVK